MVSPGLYYERGLLHPFVDYDVPPPWLNSWSIRWTTRATSTSPRSPDLGQNINWDYINSHMVD